MNTKSHHLLLQLCFLYGSFLTCLGDTIAVVGRKIGLSCNATHWGERDVALILWYKTGKGAPLYTIDARGGNERLSSARHSPSSPRYQMNVSTIPPMLYIEPVESEDQGEYRCRVDYRSDRTHNFITSIRVVEPPSRMAIVDGEGQELDGNVGPYNEGYHFVAICQTDGGNPHPSLTWWSSTEMVGPSWTQTGQRVTNELRIPNLAREDLLKQLECKAVVENGTVLGTRRLTIDLNLKPLKVELIRPEEPLSSGRKAELECLSFGSRPPAEITWWKGAKKMDRVTNTYSNNNNLTRSRLIFIPTTEDSGKHLTCRSVNPSLPDSGIEDGFTLNVHYVPQLTINLGATIKRDSIREGNDVILDCSIKANPKVEEILWTFEGKPLKSNKTAGIFITNHSLVIQKVKRHHRGNYRCYARNKEGQSESDLFFLRVKYAPRCKEDQKTIYATARNEIVRVSCNLDADPLDLKFKWHMNTSSQNLEIRSIISNGSQSIAIYRPQNRFSYGYMQCSGENEIGKLKEPCLFHIIPAGPPERVTGCKISNHSMSALFLDCTPGEGHGLQQAFFLEVYNTLSNAFVANYSNPMKPMFLINNLPPGTSFTLIVYAVNVKGRSGPVSLIASTLAEPEKQMSHESIDQVALNPLLILLIAFVGVMVIISIAVVIVLRIRADRYDNINGDDHERRLNDAKAERHPEETNGFGVYTSTRNTRSNSNLCPRENDSLIFELLESKSSTPGKRSLPETQYLYRQHTAGISSLQQTPTTEISNDISLDGYFSSSGRLSTLVSPSVECPDNLQSRRRVAFINDSQLLLPDRESLVADGCSDRETPIESASAMNNLKISCDGNEVTISFQLPKDHLTTPMSPRSLNRATPV